MKHIAKKQLTRQLLLESPVLSRRTQSDNIVVLSIGMRPSKRLFCIFLQQQTSTRAQERAKQGDAQGSELGEVGH